MGGEVIAQPNHLLLVGCGQWLVDTLMKTDEVDATGQVAEEANEFFGVLGCIIDACPSDIFKTEAALVSKIVVT